MSFSARARTTIWMGFVLSTAPLTQAQVFDSVLLRNAEPGTDGGYVGLTAISAPEYLGSDQRKAAAFPAISYQWANGWFAGLDNGLGYNFSTNPAWHYGLRLTADMGRKSDDSANLRGMGDVDAKPELGGFVTFSPADGLAFTGSVRYGSGQSSNGTVVGLGVGYSVSLAPQWRLGGRLGVTLADRQHMQSYFGVDAQQSSRSGHRLYTPDAGLRDTNLGLSLTYAINPRTYLSAELSGNMLGSDAKNSPLARSSQSSATVLALTYAF